jgi:aminoglycoside phosphotransferase (APT) family kinase protein
VERPVLTAVMDGPPGEIHVDLELVAVLLAQQHPNLATLPLRPAESGFDNYMFRLGESFAVRLPRSAVAARLLANEQKWLITLSDRLPLQIPVPLRVGQPGFGFPWRWSVVPWLAGTTAEVAPVHAREAARLERTTDTITGRVRDAWREALAAPNDTQPTWIHGDLHARNVLTIDGTITGVIDWGDMTSGDPAIDLAALWMLLPDEKSRAQAQRAYGAVSTALWTRARGWAVLFGVMLLDTGLAGNARNAAMGEQILRRI